MQTRMMTVAEASERIRAGSVMLAAGAAPALAQLPRGRWIGGTASHFITAQGGREDRARLMCTEIESALEARVRTLTPEALPTLAQERYAHGATLILIPAFCEAHERFALDGATWPGLFEQPLMGWIAGVHPDEAERARAKVIDGESGRMLKEGAVLMHLALPPGVSVELDILNPFEPGEEPATRFVFAETGFSARTATVKGREVALADYLTKAAVDLRLPLVANYAGARVNVSFRSVDAGSGEVRFYAPVVAGVEYRQARPLADYAAAFAAAAPGDAAERLSCNCVLNYLHGGLEGKAAGGYLGPATFGEIAYILLNQTLVQLDLRDGAAGAAA
ncbi:hypothetical protein P2H44_19125 [Albimonas sp. CAU 1670]|uniref:DUF6976 family protein n=1 Tax=Albimonas sp. CAU 1670 TaxID=3032599 RepID=UPI0023D97960|nr:hypothetical protein [Albimonas sp. CAU 1670]MDF2234677.1 hypothetical protein [Albimonas sp. CAU 1670]